MRVKWRRIGERLLADYVCPDCGGNMREVVIELRARNGRTGHLRLCAHCDGPAPSVLHLLANPQP